MFLRRARCGNPMEELRLRYHAFPIMPSWFPPGTASVDYQPITAYSHDREVDVTLLPGTSQHWSIAIYEWRGPQTVMAECVWEAWS
jgi:hypothetical protein